MPTSHAIVCEVPTREGGSMYSFPLFDIDFFLLLMLLGLCLFCLIKSVLSLAKKKIGNIIIYLGAAMIPTVVIMRLSPFPDYISESTCLIVLIISISLIVVGLILKQVQII